LGNVSKDAEGLKELKVMLDAVTDEELDNPEKVNGIARERIAKTKPVEKVRGLVFLHKNTRFYHLVLKMRKAPGDRMPTSPSEMNKMFEEDPRVKPIFQEVFMADAWHAKISRIENMMRNMMRKAFSKLELFLSIHIKKNNHYIIRIPNFLRKYLRLLDCLASILIPN
jgi:signal recognition particle GTPase